MHLSKVQQKTIPFLSATHSATHRATQLFSNRKSPPCYKLVLQTTVEKLHGLTAASATQKVHQARASPPPGDRPATRSRLLKQCGGAERAPTPSPAASLPTVAAPSLLPPDRPDTPLSTPGAPDCPDFWLLKSHQQVSFVETAELRGRDARAPCEIVTLTHNRSS